MNIVLFGEMGAGKSTVANYIRDTFEYTKLAFGSKIHSECKLHGKETRNEMQNYGQMMRKIFGKNVWCDYVYNQSLKYNRVVIEDGRQLNEYDYYTDLGYMPVGVITNDDIRIERLKKRINYVFDPTTSQHETEIQARTCVNKCNIQLYNNSDDINDLIKEIENKIGQYLGGVI